MLSRREFFRRMVAIIVGSVPVLTPPVSVLVFNTTRGRLEWTTVQDERTRHEYNLEKKEKKEKTT